MTIFFISILIPIIAGFITLKIKNTKTRNYFFMGALLLNLLSVFAFAKSGSQLLVWQIREGLTIFYCIDNLGIFFSYLISIIWLLVGIYSVEYLKHEERPAQFMMFYLLTLAALISLCFAGNMMTLYFSFEMMTLLSFPMVIHTREMMAVRGGLKYIGYSIGGAGLGLLGFFFLNTYAISTDFVAGGNLNMDMVAGNENLLIAVFFIMAVGFSCKAGMFPLHGWLPTAHPVAPSPASAVLSGIITKAGVICLIRVVYYMFGADFIRGTWAQTAYLILTVLTIFMGSMLAYKEKILKKRLAYSTVSQLSYVLFGIMLLTPMGMSGALLQVVFHAIAKNALFLCAGAVIYKTGKTQVDELVGIGREMPVIMGVFTIASLSLIGIPPMCGFVSKWALVEGALYIGEPIMLIGVAVLMLSALLTAGYLMSIVIMGFFKQTEQTLAVAALEPNLYMRVPLVILGAGILVLGVFNAGLVAVISEITTLIF